MCERDICSKSSVNFFVRPREKKKKMCIYVQMGKVERIIMGQASEFLLPTFEYRSNATLRRLKFMELHA